MVPAQNDLAGGTGIFEALQNSHEEILDEHCCEEAEQELKKIAGSNGDPEFSKRLQRIKGSPVAVRLAKKLRENSR